MNLRIQNASKDIFSIIFSSNNEKRRNLVEFSWATGEFSFFLYCPIEIFEFSFNSRCKTVWSPGYMGRVLSDK